MAKELCVQRLKSDIQKKKSRPLLFWVVCEQASLLFCYNDTPTWVKQHLIWRLWLLNGLIAAWCGTPFLQIWLFQ